MTKDIVFRVEISFADNIDEHKFKQEIAEKIANLLAQDVYNRNGLIPDDSDTVTEHIRVTPNYNGKTVIISF